MGNRITRDLEVGTDTVYSSNEVNEYTAIGGSFVSHDDAGNFTADHRGYAYEYDYENRLTAIMKDSGSTTVATFAYDALGRRVESTGNTYGTYKFYYDGWRVLREERVASPTLTFNNEYVYGNYLDEVCMMNLRLNDAVQAYSYYFVHDHLYSTVAWLYSTSGIIHRYEYNAYGQRKIMNADYTDAAYSFNHISFTGQRQDDLDGGNLSLMYYKNRYYDTQTGRFLTRDPLVNSDNFVLRLIELYEKLGHVNQGVSLSPSPDFQRYTPGKYIDGMNLYQYVLGQATGKIDPLGLASCNPCQPHSKPYWKFIREYVITMVSNWTNLPMSTWPTIITNIIPTPSLPMTDSITKYREDSPCYCEFQARQKCERCCTETHNLYSSDHLDDIYRDPSDVPPIIGSYKTSYTEVKEFRGRVVLTQGYISGNSYHSKICNCEDPYPEPQRVCP